MQTVKNLLKSEKNKVLGNHRVEKSGNIDRYYYYWTNICTVDNSRKIFTVDNGGYGTISTTRAINAYVRELTYMGYKQVETLEIAA